MFILYDVGKSLTIDELIDSNKMNIFDQFKGANFYCLNVQSIHF